QAGVARVLEAGIAGEQHLRRATRALVQCFVAQRIGDPERRHATLPLAEQVAHTANAQVLSRDLEAVLGARKNLKPRGGVGADVAEKDAKGFVRAAANPAAQLMQLRQAESLRML